MIRCARRTPNRFGSSWAALSKYHLQKTSSCVSYIPPSSPTVVPTLLVTKPNRCCISRASMLTFSTDASSAGATSDSSAAGRKAEEGAKEKDNSNVFLDNLGTVFLAGIGLLIATLVRSYMGSTNRNKLRESLQDRASLDPLEIDDLRVANSELTLPVYRKICQDLLQEFPEKKATYHDFVRTARGTMKGLKGEAFTIQLGHLFDRVVLSALKDHGQTSEEPQSLAFWLTVLSLALNAPVPDRILALYEVLEVIGDGEKVTLADTRAMVGWLQDTCQLVPDSQVVAIAQKYPTQQYGRGVAGELFEWEGSESDPVDIDAFASVLRSRAVCAWGECYHKKKFV